MNYFKKLLPPALVVVLSLSVFAAPRPKIDPAAVFEPVTVVSTDTKGLPESASGENFDIRSVSVTNDGKNLKISVEFSERPSAFKSSKITILIDDMNLGSEKTSFTDRNWRNPASYTKVNTSIEYSGFDAVEGGSHVGKVVGDSKWVLDSPTGLYTATSNVLTYTVPLIQIKDSFNNVALPVDSFRVVVIFSECWSSDDPLANGTVHPKDIVPASSSLVSKNKTEADSVSIDFYGAIYIPALKQIK